MSMSGGRWPARRVGRIIGGMNLIMRDSRLMSSDELRSFLRSSEALVFKGSSRTETYAWIEKTLRDYKYLSQPRAEKGLLRQYLSKTTSYSPAQLTRLIAQFCRTGHLQERPYRRHRFPTKFIREDQLLLAEVDQAHDRLSGPATQAILKREYKLFRHQEFQRLSTISVAHIYRLRRGSFYRNHTWTFHKTKPATARYGERRRPDPYPRRRAQAGSPRLLARRYRPPRRSREGERGLSHQHDQ